MSETREAIVRMAALEVAFCSVHALSNLPTLDEVWFAQHAPEIEARVSGHGAGLRSELDALAESLATAALPWLGLLDDFVELLTGDRFGKPTMERLRVLRRLLPIETLEAITGKGLGLVPRSLASPALIAELDRGVADGHLHSGGATPTVLMLEGLLVDFANTRFDFRRFTGGRLAEWEATLPGFVGLDASRNAVNLFPVILGIGIAGTVAAHGSARIGSLLEAAGVVGQRVKTETFWHEIARLARSGHGLLARDVDPLVEALRLLGSRSATPQIQTLFALARGARLRARERGTTAAYLAHGALVATGVIHAAVTSPLRADLASFGERFALHSRVRKSRLPFESRYDRPRTHGSPLGARVVMEEVDRIRQTLSYLCRTSCTERIELRKTVRLQRRADGRLPLARDEILEDIANHATAACAFSADNASSPLIQMPVGFYREKPRAPAALLVEERLRHRTSLPTALAVAQGLAAVIREVPAVIPFVGGVDVAGPEGDSPNWVYALAFGHLESLLAGLGQPGCLSYTVHAGEFFGSALEGLRHIGEILLFPVPVSRVAHCTALSSGPAKQARAARAAAVLDNLCWAFDYGATRGVPLPGVDIRYWIEHLTLDIYGAGLPASAVVSAYRARFDPTSVARIGVSALQWPQLDEVIDWADGMEPPARRFFDEAAEALLFATVFEVRASLGSGRRARTVAFDTDAAASRVVDAKLADLEQVVYDALRPSLQRELADRAVVIETCPSSNLSTAGFDHFGEHPLREFLDEGMSCTVNSDDPGLFGARVFDEYVALEQTGRYELTDFAALRELGLAVTASGALDSVEIDRILGLPLY